MKHAKWVLTLIIGVFMQNASGQEVPAGVDATFSLASLDPMLSAGKADAVVRLDNQQFLVKNRGKAVWRLHRAITVFNANGRDYGIVGYGYDKLRKPQKLEAQIRDASGKVIRKLKKDEIEDYSAISEYSLYDDSRIRVARMEHAAFPYTVEYWYEIEYNGYISWPSWEPGDLGLSVEHARFEVYAPADINVRYHTKGDHMEPLIIPDGKQKVYRWEVASLRKETSDLLASLSMEFAPEGSAMRVKVAPEYFEIEGSAGDMRTWASFGQWYYHLNQGRDYLPPDKLEEVAQVINGANNDEEKIRSIYNFFQSTTRYVSVQLGIGGWQTYDAFYVAKRGYGDCKALSNYLKALLGAAGITSYPVLIQNSRGVSEVDKSFPDHAFNHVILMVPTAADTLWLEATSQIMPFGHIGAGNEARYALAVTPSGGELVRTPGSSSTRNARIRNASVVIEPSGNATAAYEVVYKGNQQDLVTAALVEAPPLEQLAWLHNSLEIPSFKVLQADFSGVKSRQDTSRITADLELPRYASRTGSRMFVSTNLLERRAYVPPENEGRTTPVNLVYAFHDEDQITYVLPAGYQIEMMPEDVFIETSFATFSVTHNVDEDALHYKRQLAFNRREIDAGMYDSYRDFMLTVAKADRAQVVLVKE